MGVQESGSKEYRWGGSALTLGAWGLRTRKNDRWTGSGESSGPLEAQSWTLGPGPAPPHTHRRVPGERDPRRSIPAAGTAPGMLRPAPPRAFCICYRQQPPHLTWGPEGTQGPPHPRQSSPAPPAQSLPQATCWGSPSVLTDAEESPAEPRASGQGCFSPHPYDIGPMRRPRHPQKPEYTETGGWGAGVRLDPRAWGRAKAQAHRSSGPREWLRGSDP